jgi:predicted aspartyl protease
MVEDRTTIEFGPSGITGVPLCPPDELVCCIAAGPGGHPLHVLIDTGTDPSAIDARLARRLALQTGGTGMGYAAASDEVAFTEAVLPWLRIGDLTIRDLFAPAVDLSSLPFPVDVVLGYNVLRQMTLRIDYRERALTCAHPDVGLSAPGGVALELAFFEHFPALRDIVVDGLHIPLATIDTGSNGALTVGPDLAAQLGMYPGATGVTHARGAYFGGAAEIIRRDAAHVQLHGFSLTHVPLDANLAGGGDLGRSGRANIGNRLLARFATIILDYERRQITLVPQPE